MTAEQQRTYYRRNKSERYRKQTEKRQRQREEAQSYKALFRAMREKREAIVQVEHERRKQLRRELAAVLKGGLDGR